MVYEGPNIVVKIKKELKELLINKDASNFQDIIGKKENYFSKDTLAEVEEFLFSPYSWSGKNGGSDISLTPNDIHTDVQN